MRRLITRLEARCELFGWLLFVASAMFYIASGLRSGDPISLVGALLFLVACLVFLLPYRHRGKIEIAE